jgi:ATP-dependent RNA helicase UAP56/SUB2
MSHDNEDLIDYEDDAGVSNGPRPTASAAADSEEKKNFSGIHSTGFR